MANQNLISLVLSSFLASFVIYKCCARKKDIIEPFGSLSVPTTISSEKIKNGETVCGGQQNFSYDTNPIVNPLYFTNDTIKTGMSDLKEYQNRSQLQSNSGSTEQYCGGCNSKDSEPSAPFYSVPGNKDAYLSPRFDPNGVASKVRYDLPDEKYLANKPNDPFTIAGYFEKPKTQENYKPAAKSSMSSQDASGVDLPKDATMSNNGALKEESKDGFVINGERLMFSPSKSFGQGQGCPIRGDLPVIPIVPQCSTDSLVSFRPAASAYPQQALRTGAINVIGGVGNTTAMSLQNLKSNATSGMVNSTGGVPILPPPGTIGAQSYSMANNIVGSSQSGNGPPGTITFDNNNIMPSAPSLAS